MSAPVMARPAPADRRDDPGLSLWRLERLRLLRTHRWVILVGAYLFFGVLGPLTARYFNELMGRMGGEMTIIAPDPRPVDGLIQFVSNAGQLGLLAVVAVAAAALAFDGHPERAAFLRTRVERPGRLIVPPYVVTVVVTVVALLLGTVVTVALTAALIGPLPAGPVVVGTGLGALYLAFAIAVVAAVAGSVRSQVATVFASLGLLLVLPMLAMIDPVRPWLPSELLTAVIALTEGAPVGDYLRATVVAVAATAGLLLLATRGVDRREL
jgi:ABC-2 type transport system permease protein